MPPHLHPRSTATSTLFAGTLLASFVVVAIPHVLPCPRPRRVGYQDTEVILDADGKPIRRIRKRVQANVDVNQDPAGQEEISSGRSQPLTSKPKTIAEETQIFQQLKDEAEVLSTQFKDRECPVPKPKTVLGRLMGQSTKAATD